MALRLFRWPRSTPRLASAGPASFTAATLQRDLRTTNTARAGRARVGKLVARRSEQAERFAQELRQDEWDLLGENRG